jgi:hypothetical protein
MELFNPQSDDEAQYVALSGAQSDDEANIEPFPGSRRRNANLKPDP